MKTKFKVGDYVRFDDFMGINRIGCIEVIAAWR